MLYWDTGPYFWTFFSEQYSFYSKCFDSVTEPSTIQGRSEHPWHASAGEVPMLDSAGLEYPSTKGAWIERTAKNDKRIILPRTSSGLAKRVQQVDGSVPPVWGGCFCPATDVRNILYMGFTVPQLHLERD